MGLSRSAIEVFGITAGFDLALNLLPPPLGATRIRPYFQAHTPLSAALVAGFVGATTFWLLLSVFAEVIHPSAMSVFKVFLVSALVGFPMQWSGAFPHLNRHYYERFPREATFLSDGFSGVMVASVFWWLRSFRGESEDACG